MKKMLLAVTIAGVLGLGGGNVLASPAFHTTGSGDILEIQRERMEPKAFVSENKLEQKMVCEPRVAKRETSSSNSASHTALFKTRGISDVLGIMQERARERPAK
jgi:hypothetical protein